MISVLSSYVLIHYNYIHVGPNQLLDSSLQVGKSYAIICASTTTSHFGLNHMHSVTVVTIIMSKERPSKSNRINKHSQSLKGKVSSLLRPWRSSIVSQLIVCFPLCGFFQLQVLTVEILHIYWACRTLLMWRMTDDGWVPLTRSPFYTVTEFFDISRNKETYAPRMAGNFKGIEPFMYLPVCEV